MLAIISVAVIMDSAMSFGDWNSGLQVAINHGPITAEFHPLKFDDKLPTVHGAAFDSYVNQHEDECLPGTRTDILRRIREWASSPRCIFWLNGMAGTGKSTISRTVAKSCDQAKSLGASFFFKRGEGDRGNATKLFPTIAVQLANNVPQLMPIIRTAVQDDPAIAMKGIKEQFEKLLLQPLIALRLSNHPIKTMMIVIDALDECEGEKDIRLILQLLPQLQKPNAVRLRVFLTSRPELPIRLGFKHLANHDHKDLVLHEIPKEVIEDDISLFMNYRLSEIRKEREPPLPIDWPGATNIRNLVALSVPLFIFAATICRIFEDPDWDPLDSLPEILTYQRNKSKLDATYLPILNRLLNRQGEKQRRQLIQEYQQVVGAIVLLESPLSVISLSRLIGLPERLISLRLNPLHSILSVPDDKIMPVRLFHLSFRDFLLDPETRQKTSFWIDKKKMHASLTTRCLLICENLRKNICGLPSDGTQRANIDQQTIDHCLPPELQYSCRYWAHHLIQCTDLRDVMQNVLSFLQRHFLHWVEAMNLLGVGSEVVGIINLLQTGVAGDNHSTMSEFLHDAKRFILKTRQIANEAPLQLYCSGLVFAPQNAIIRREFETTLPNWIIQFPQVEKTWGLELQTLEGHSGCIQSVAFSPDGRLLVSGSDDKTVRLWDTATGALQQTLKGHSGSIQSVAFSPDGRLLASGSLSKTIRLWDTSTGALQQKLEGHSNSVWSVAFSPDSRLLVSGSDDKTVRLWDTAIGALQQTLKGHSNSVWSVAFSPDGRLLVSGSDDKTLRLWDTSTGVLQQTLEGHSGCIQSVAFSPDGRLLVSGSDDKTVRLWDTATGALHQTIEGHLDWIRSVAFSPDGRLLASGSDKTVRLWDTATGALQHTLKGHSDSIESVVFSPDGRLLASGSWDKIVRLWDTAAGALQQNLEGHPDLVRSIAFSAAGSDSKTVRLWDTAIGALRQTLEGYSNSIRSVVFSPDSRLLASCSDNKEVRLWDAAAGALQQTLTGHPDLVRSVAFSPDGLLLASSSDSIVRLWDTATGALQQTLDCYLDWNRSVAFSSGSNDQTVRLWDTATGALKQTLKGHSDWVRSVAFSPDGQLLACGSLDKTVRLWDTATGALKQTLECHPDLVRSVAFSPDGRLLASYSGVTVRLWDTATGVQQTIEGRLGWINGPKFPPDGSYLSTIIESLGIQHSEVMLPRLNPETFLQRRQWIRATGEKVLWLPPKARRSLQGSLGISVQRRQWITLNGEKVLWLPPEARPSCWSIKDNTLVMGHASGRISFIGFRV